MEKKLKIVFFGTPEFAVESLNAIVQNGFDVAAVVTATDKPAGRGHKMLSSAVKKYALERNLPLLQPESLKDHAFVDSLARINADLFVVIAFRMLPEIVWNMPPLGTFNLHASLLPRYRGAAPINRAVMNGERRTGVTTFFLTHEIDTGDVIDRVEIDIDDDENAGEVHDRLMKLGAELTVKTIRLIQEGKLNVTSQNQMIEEGAVACPAPKIFKETGKIDWQNNATNIHNLVRGLSPFPGAWTILESENSAPAEIKIFRTEKTSRPSTLPPGTIEIEKDDMFVNTGSEMLKIKEVQLAGKKRMNTSDFLRGSRLEGIRCRFIS